jgi:Amt family ammonium transporter
MASPLPHDVWPVAAALSIVLVLAGQVTLESGLVRAKHSVNVAAKALVQLGLAVLIAWAIGHGIMNAGGPLAGNGPFLPGEATPAILFHLILTAGAVAILSGALAERTTLRGYALAVALDALLIVPLIVHWVWAARPDGAGWLRAIGFVDFAGGGVIHVAGGTAALVAAAIVGPRTGRFGGARKVAVIQSQGFPFAALGALLLWLGWFGFAIGQAQSTGVAPAIVVLNLVLAGAAAVTAAFVANQLRPAEVSVIDMIHATLAGIIAASAGAHVLAPLGAVGLGIGGAAVAILGARLVAKAEIDDPLGVASAHAFAGGLGVLAVALCEPATIAGSLVVQAVGLLAIVSWSAAIMAAGLYGARFLVSLRVTPEQERVGLNVSEHRMTTDVAILVSQLGSLNRNAGSFSYLEADADGELGQVAREYNRAIDIFHAQIRGVKEKLSLAEAATDQAGRMNAQLATDLADRDRRLEEATREVSFLTDQVARSLIAVESLQGMRSGLVKLIGRTFRQPIERLHLMAKRAGSSRHQADIDALIEAAREESARLARRLADVIDYAQASSFETPPVADRAPVEKVIGEVNLLYRPRAENKGVKLRVVWTPDVSAMSASATALRKIMGELVNVAIESTGEGGLVNFSAKRGAEGELIVDVVDSGVGLSPGQLAQALDPTAEATGGQEEGAGVGLALVKKLVEMHGGTLSIRSRPGIGTQVRATIDAEHLTQPAAQAG